MVPTWPVHLLTALLLAASGGSLGAQTFRTALGTAWTTPENWGGTLPTKDGTANLLFSQAGNLSYAQGTSTLDEDWNVGTITWNATALSSGKVTLNASTATLTLQGGLNNGSAGRVEVYPVLSLDTVQTWSDTSTETTSAFSSPGTRILGAIKGNGGIRKTGNGTIRLNSTSNSYAGGNIINAGVLEVPDYGALGSAASVQIDGGTLRFASYPLTKMTVVAPQNIMLGTAGGTIQTRYGDTTFSGTITGAGQLRLMPDPSWGTFLQSRYTWSGTNDYAGGTVIGAVSATLTGTARTLGTGGVTVQADGVLSLAAESNLAAGQKIALQTGSVLVLSSAAINPANIIDSSAATTGGTLALGVDYSASLNMATLGNGQLFLGSIGSVTYTGATLGAGAGNVYRLGGGSRANDASAPPVVLTVGGAANLFTGARSVLIGSSIFQTSDAVNSSKVVFQNANNYTLGTTIFAGTLAVGHDNALGSGTVTITAADNVGALLAEAPSTLPNPIVFNAPANSGFAFGGTSDLTLTGTVNLGGTAHTFTGGGSRTTFTNTISNGALTLSGGVWSLTGTNTFAGLTLSAELEFSQDHQLGSTGSTLTLKGGRLVPTVSLSTSRPLALTTSGGIVDTNGQNLTFSGPVTGTLGTTLTKVGLGTLVMQGGSKAGFVTVKEGTVRFDNTGAAGSMVVYVEAGATLGGNGSVGLVNLYAGAHLAPGTTTPGALRLNGDLSLTSSALLDFDLGLTLFDEIILGSGTLARRNGTGPVLINVTDAGGLALGQTFTLIDWTAAAGTPTLADFQVGPGAVQGDLAIIGKTLRFTATQIPEPTAVGLLLASGVLLAARARRRQRPKEFRFSN